MANKTAMAQAMRTACRPVTLFDTGFAQQVFSGGVAERRIVVLNGSLQPHKLILKWHLAPGTSDWQVVGERDLTLAPGENRTVTISLALPALTAPLTEAAFSLELREGTRLVDESHATWQRVGREAWTGKLDRAPRRVAVYDPAGTLAPVLSEAGIEPTALEEKDPQAALRRASLAIVGEEALKEGAAETAPLQALLSYVRDGGSLVVLTQRTLPWDLPVSLVPQEASLAFVRDPADPVLEGLDDRDFVHWGPNGLLGDTLLAKTTWGGFRPLVECGSTNGLNAAALAEVRLGKGRLLLCQLPLVRRYGVDPGATRLLRNLLALGNASLGLHAAPRPARDSGDRGLADGDRGRQLPRLERGGPARGERRADAAGDRPRRGAWARVRTAGLRATRRHGDSSQSHSGQRGSSHPPGGRPAHPPG